MRLNDIRKSVDAEYGGHTTFSKAVIRHLLNLVDQAGDWMVRSKTLAGGADHDRGDKYHLASDEEKAAEVDGLIGYLVIEEMGCNYGMWLLPDSVTEEEEDAHPEPETLRVQVKECTCGYNDLLRALGKEVE